MKKKYQSLFETFNIGNVEIKNKFFMAPMATIIDVDENYCYTNQSVDYYVRRAQGGVGLIVTGANWVENDIENHAPCSFACPNMLPGKYKKKAKEMTDRVHSFGSKIFLQLTAGLGRSALPAFMNNEDYVAPSEISNRWDPSKMCRELKTEEIDHIIDKFVDAAVVGKESGFDGIEIHAVHEGYLLDCFTLSLFNKRTDKYGGDLRARLLFATEIVRRIKEECGKDFPVILRFSIKSYVKAIRQGGLPGEKFEELGRDVEEAKEAIKILEEAGYDAFDSDAGTYDSWYWAHPPMYFGKGVYLDLAKQIKGVASVPIMMAGRMDDPDLAVESLNSGIIDAVGLGRPLLTDPDYVNKLRDDKTEYILPCLGCHDGCFGRALEHGLGSCAVNPECGRERTVGIKKADCKKDVLVVGGGPAGLEAARVSALRGYDVTLIEARERVGGALLIGGVPKFKSNDLDLVKYYENQLERLGVKVILNKKADKKYIDQLNPDILYIGEGARPIVPPIEGVENAVLAQDILLGNVKTREKVTVVGGGLVGCELALHLAQNGKDVTVVEALDDIFKAGNKLPPMNEFMLRDLLKFNNVNIKTNTRVTKINKDNLELSTENGNETIDSDQTILAIGYHSNHELFDELKYDYAYIYKLGDGRKVSNIRSAIWDGYEVARSL
ncbi:MAG: FAD-dependent oxidoreductase [Peptostreptococcus sp.]|uniref:oxidoreductase n=1 Tax=Peptostreptococcus sp. TaxID=1262 RepID=UPI002FCAA1AE